MFSSRYKNKNPQGSNPGDPSDGERNTAQQHSRTKSPSIAVAPMQAKHPLSWQYHMSARRLAAVPGASQYRPSPRVKPQSTSLEEIRCKNAHLAIRDMYEVFIKIKITEVMFYHHLGFVAAYFLMSSVFLLQAGTRFATFRFSWAAVVTFLPVGVVL